MLTGDAQLAGMTNVLPSRGIRDIYTETITALNKFTAEKQTSLSAIEGTLSSKDAETLEILKGLKFDRKIGKILVMLTPYNVSTQGFADRLLEALTGATFSYNGKPISFVAVFSTSLPKGASKDF